MDKNLVIAGRPDLQEEYLAELIDDSQPGINPIVRVKAVLRYPIQHAIYWPDVVCENSPIQAGLVCRLHFLRAATPEEAGLYSDYPKSLAAAQRAALDAAETDGEREIIRRHMEGDYRRRRLARFYTASELEQHMKYRGRKS